VNTKDGLIISGAIKWPETISSSDKIAPFIKHKYGLRPDFWKEEDDEWIHDRILSASGENEAHIMTSHYCPLPYMSNSNIDYSLYNRFLVHPQPLKGWIYGGEKITATGYCPHKQTFMGSNSRDGGTGYCPEMIMCV
jgi:hypothetical protein